MAFDQARILILAAGSGIGQTLARLLAAQGASLYLTGRSEERVSALAAELDAPYSVLDASDFEAVGNVFAQASEALGGLSGVVCCAGSLILKPAHLTSARELNDTIAASLLTAFATVRAAGTHLAKQGGSVVLIGTAAAGRGIANHEAIAAAKGGVHALALSAAATYASANIRVNVVAPGLTQTSLTARLTGSDMARKASEAMHALGRLGKPEDIAAAIAFLLDPANDWITGQILAVDGGLSSLLPKVKETVRAAS